jgi:hypothetical protein
MIEFPVFLETRAQLVNPEYQISYFFQGVNQKSDIIFDFSKLKIPCPDKNGTGNLRLYGFVSDLAVSMDFSPSQILNLSSASGCKALLINE